MSALDDAFAARDLLRPGQAARALGVEVDVVMRYAKAGALRCEVIDWHGQPFRGIPRAEVDRVKALMDGGT